jgi:hypothetical protein
MTAVPWNWTDLPVLPEELRPLSDSDPILVLSPAALRDLVRFLIDRRNKPNVENHFTK